MNGQAVENGTISFIPADRDPTFAAWAKIKAGSYSIPAGNGPGEGANQIEIRWSRRTGKTLHFAPPIPDADEFVEAIPARYNSRSELRIELKPGANELDFELNSK